MINVSSLCVFSPFRFYLHDTTAPVPMGDEETLRESAPAKVGPLGKRSFGNPTKIQAKLHHHEHEGFKAAGYDKHHF